MVRGRTATIIIAGLLSLAVGLLSLAVTGNSRAAPFQDPATPPVFGVLDKSDQRASVELLPSYGKLLVSFEPDQGQTDSRVDFLSRGRGCTFVTLTEAVLSLQRSAASTRADDNDEIIQYVLRMELLGANRNAKVAGENKRTHLLGKDPTNWHSGIPTDAHVRHEDIYPGIDLAFYGNQGKPEYDFVVVKLSASGSPLVYSAVCAVAFITWGSADFTYTATPLPSALPED